MNMGKENTRCPERVEFLHIVGVQTPARSSWLQANRFVVLSDLSVLIFCLIIEYWNCSYNFFHDLFVFFISIIVVLKFHVSHCAILKTRLGTTGEN